MRPLEVFRAAYGMAELLAPGALEGAVTGTTPNDRAKAVFQILGGRHVLQAAATARAGRGLRCLGGGVDVLHALSMAALAAVDPKRRRLALANAAIALAFAVGELR
ncbi:hypothetical protein [Sinomonas albida]|uniref:hypothetical protein n=1 Tax=Sinomonas albida TaxID=369942 RepID=UPI0030166088